MASNDRYFIKPSTVHLRARISEPGSRQPTDATVVLTALRLGATPVTVATTAFTRLALGDYTLSIPTADLAAGAYDVVVTVSDGPDKISVLTDRFVVQDA